MTQTLDLQTPEFADLLVRAPIYRKSGFVQIRDAVPGEQIDTVLADGTVETSRTAGENEVVITNPGGEEYVVGKEKAMGRYEETETPGTYKAKGLIRAITNPTGDDIEITAPWGEVQRGGADCKIAMLLGEDLNAATADRYIIGGEEFTQTYAFEAGQSSGNDAVQPDTSR